MAKVSIDILSRYLGTKGFKLAQKDVSKLERSMKTLGKTFVTYFGAKALYNFGKKSVAAFVADDKAARQLSYTLKNLGLAFQDPAVKDFIAQSEQLYGVLDDKLRPAFQKLLTTTGSVAQSEKILTAALNVAAASGADVEAVASDLANAYVGNYKGLRQYGLGLSAAELKTISFEQILSKITDIFGNSAAKAAETYSGKIDKLKVSYANMQEVVGQGLVDAFTILSGDQGIGGATSAMEKFGKTSSDVLRGIALTLKPLTNSTPGSTSFAEDMLTATIGPLRDAANYFARKGAALRVAQEQANTGGGIGGSMSMQDKIKESNARKVAKSEADAAKARKKQLQLMNEANRKQAEALKQKKLGYLMDIDQIEIVAALQRTLDEDTRTRLKLQLALIQGQQDEATVLAQKLSELEPKNQALALFLKNLPDAKNPFKDWQSWLDAIEASTLASAKRMKEALAGIGNNPTPTPTPKDPYKITSPIDVANKSSLSNPSYDPYKITSPLDIAAASASNFTSYDPYKITSPMDIANASINVTVNLDGQQISSTVTDYQQNSTASGVVIGTKRNLPDWTYGW